MQTRKAYEKRVESGLQPFVQNASPKKPLRSFSDFLKYFYPRQGDFIALVGNLITIPDLIRFKKTIKPQIPCQWLPVPNNGKWIQGTGFSDHSPFWLQGYRAMMITDTAFLRNPHYHKPTDTIDTLDGDFLTAACSALIAALKNL